MASNPLIGTWRLISWENRSVEDGQVSYPLGKDAEGYPWRIGASQRDDKGVLGFRDASLAPGARAIAKPIESLGVEAMDALANRLWVAPQSSEAMRAWCEVVHPS